MKLPHFRTINQDRLSTAVRDAFAKRGTATSAKVPDGLSQDFAGDIGKGTQWKVFLKQNVTSPRAALLLLEVIDALASFLLPVLAASGADGQEVSLGGERIWPPGRPWK